MNSTQFPHVVDPLPERVQLIHAPGVLRGVALETRRWRRFVGELVIERRADLPLAPGNDLGPSMGVIAMPDGWRRLGEVLAGVRASVRGKFGG